MSDIQRYKNQKLCTENCRSVTNEATNKDKFNKTVILNAYAHHMLLTAIYY